jgi:hypothetical protein
VLTVLPHLAFRFLSPRFCFRALEHLDLSLVSLWGHPCLSVASAYGEVVGALSSSAHQLQHLNEVAEQNTFIIARLADCFPVVRAV